MNTITVSGYRGKLDDKGKWGTLTVKEIVRQKNRTSGEFENVKQYWDVTVFEREMNFIKQYTEDGQALSVTGHIKIDKSAETNKKYYNLMASSFFWAPKTERRTKPEATSSAPIDDDDIPF